jgi:hypothetical protein
MSVSVRLWRGTAGANHSGSLERRERSYRPSRAGAGPEDGHRARSAKHSKLRKYLPELKAAGLIGVDGEILIHLRRAP